MTKRKIIDVLIPPGYKPPKKDIEVAWILAKNHKTTVNILKPVNSYKIKTPDFFFNKNYYELKVITSTQVRQLLVQLERAKKQSSNIILDIRKSKINEKRAKAICAEFTKNNKKYNVSLIVSSDKILDIKN